MDRTRRGILARDAVNELAALGWKLRHSPPPYTEELPLPTPPRRPPWFSLLILDAAAASPGSAFDELSAIISGLRRGFLMPVFGRLAGVPPDFSPLAFQDALTAAGAELLLPEQAIAQRAHDVLTMRRNLASDWLGWHRLDRSIGRRQADAIRTLVNHDHTRPLTSVDRVLAADGLKPRSARRWLEEASLPPPRAWARASRLFRALLALQRDPDLDIYDAAMMIGYSSAESFSNAMFDCFGHNAQRGRHWLGLERRFHVFEQRAGRIRS